MKLSEMHKIFNNNISSIISTKRDDNKSFLSHNEYNARMNEVEQSKNTLLTPKSKKSMKDYRLVRKYNVITIDGKNHLVKPVADKSQPILYYVTNEDLFDILHATHIAIGHGGRNRMVADLKTKYANITKEAIMVYLRLCEVCQKKSSLKRAYLNDLSKNNCKSGESLVPTLGSAFNSRAHIDMLDMQNQSYDNFNFILVHQDHHTKFITLRALMSKRSDEIADNLLEIYTTFGPPAYIHSKEGKEFITPILNKLCVMWKELTILIGKQSLNLTSANIEITEKLAEWMTKNKSKDWPIGIKFTQYKMNCEHRDDIGKSPYEAVFRRSPELDTPDEFAFSPAQDKADEHDGIEEEQNGTKLRNYMLAEHCETVLDGQ